VGFYLQPAVGGIHLPASFWRRFAAIDNVVAIKMAPFSRYRTLDVLRGVVEAGAEARVTLYTGNDDHIVLDLLTPYRFMRDGKEVPVRIKGGLLGHWSVGTRRAVQLLARIHDIASAPSVPAELLTLDAQVTDCNAALFDVANEFRGCIAGCHEVLRRQGLLAGHLVPRPAGRLEPGPGGRAHARARRLPRTARRRLRRRTSGALARLRAASFSKVFASRFPSPTHHQETPCRSAP
jgi:hypothetical protein